MLARLFSNLIVVFIFMVRPCLSADPVQFYKVVDTSKLSPEVIKGIIPVNNKTWELKKKKLKTYKVDKIRRFLDAKTRKSSGGWSGNGGGAGVACFKTTRIANKAIDPKGRVRPQYMDKILYLRVLDIFEMKDMEYYAQPEEGESAKEFLVRMIDKHFTGLAPYFSLQLKTALSLVKVDHWLPNSQLPRIYDTGKLEKKVPGRCKIVQLVTRYAKPKKCSYPEVFLDVHPGLYQKMLELNSPRIAVYNQAILMLHEALYLLANEMYHPGASRTRHFIRFILSGFLHVKKRNFGTLHPRIQKASDQSFFRHYFSEYGFNFYQALFLAEEQDQELVRLRKSLATLTLSHWKNHRRNFGNVSPFLSWMEKNHIEKVVKMMDNHNNFIINHGNDELAFFKYAYNFWEAGWLSIDIDDLVLTRESSENAITKICTYLESDHLNFFLDKPSPLMSKAIKVGMVKKDKYEANHRFLKKLFEYELKKDKSKRNGHIELMMAARYCSDRDLLSQEAYEVVNRFIERLDIKRRPVKYPSCNPFFYKIDL